MLLLLPPLLLLLSCLDGVDAYAGLWPRPYHSEIVSRSKGELSDLEGLDGHVLCCVAAVVGAFAVAVTAAFAVSVAFAAAVAM